MSKPRVDPRPLTEGALFAGLAVILALMGFYVPVLGVFVTFLWPVPIAMIAVRHGMRTSVMTVFVAGAVLSMVVGFLEGALMTFTMGVVGLALGYALLKKWGPVATVMLAALAVMLGTLVSFGVSIRFFNLNVGQLFSDMTEAAEKVTEIYARFGIPKETTAPFIDMWKQAMDLMKLLLPGILLVGGLVNALLNYEVARRIMTRFGYVVPAMPQFGEWRFPRYTVLFFLLGHLAAGLKGAGAVEVFGRTLNIGHSSEILHLTGTNVAFAAQFLLVVQGFAIAYHFLLKLKVSKGIASFILIWVWFNPALSQFAMMFGLMDALFDYRKIAASMKK